MMSFFHKKDSSSKSKNNTSTISHDNNDADSLSSVSSSASYSLPQTQPQTQIPPQVTQHSSSSSLESQPNNTATAHNPHIVKQPGVAAKPKKGILKTMTKFTMSGISSGGGSTHNNANSSHLPNITIKPIETSSSTQNKTSQSASTLPQTAVAAALQLPIQTPTKPPQSTQTPSDHNIQTVKFKPLPIYLNPTVASQNSDQLEASLQRWVHVPVDKLDLINLSTDNTIANNEFKPIFIDALNIDEFLPGDQLIAIEDFSMLGKSVEEVKNTVNRIVSTPNRANVVRFKVRTSLPVSELVVKSFATPAAVSEGVSTSASNSSLSSLRSSNSASSMPQSTAATTTDESDSSSVWLIHSTGAYSPARIFAKIIHKSPNDNPNIIKFKIRLENGQLIEVGEEHLEKANASNTQCDLAVDLTQLRYLNETSLVHTLLTRFHSLQLIHTRLGSHTLLVLKPTQAMIDSPHFRASLYSDKVLSLVRGGGSTSQTSRKISGISGGGNTQPPPHVYSFVHAVYRRMLADRQDQSLVAMGHTAAGKTSNIKFSLNYLFKIAAPNSHNFTEEKLNAMFCLLNAFCAIRTDRNRMGANRFLNLFLLEFNHSGQLSSLLLQLIQFDQTRLFYQPTGTSNYLIFYYLIYGANQALKNELHLTSTTGDEIMSNSHLFNAPASTLWPQNARGELEEDFSAALALVIESLRVLSFEDAEIKAIFNILAALVHLGRAGALPINPAGNQQQQQRLGQFAAPNQAHIAASLLGVSFNQLNDFVFTLNNASMANGSRSSKYPGASTSRGSPAEHAYIHQNQQLQPIHCLHGFCLGLYTECISLIANCLNRAFAPRSPHAHHQPVANCILLLDPPGFQYQSSTNSALSNASYSDLICNYVSERLQLAYYQVNFIGPIERCAQEGLDVDTMCEHIPESPSAIVNWFDRPPPPGHNPTRPTSTNGFNESASTSSSSSNCGLLWLLEDQMYSPNISGVDTTFFKRLAESDPRHHFVTIPPSNSSTTKHQFTIYHQFGQFAVDYNLTEWLALYNKEYLTQRNSLPLLQQSKRDYIAQSFLSSAAMSNAAAMLSAVNQTSGMSSSGVDSPSSSANAASGLKRQASVRKMLTMSKRKTFSMNLKLQIDSIFDSLRKTRPHFLFCLLPSLPSRSNETDISLMRSQLKSYQLLAAARIYRQGYPEHVNYEEFDRRFALFLPSPSSSSSVELSSSLLRTSLSGDAHKQACVQILKALEIDSSLWKLGSTQLFFKAGVLARCEEQRDERLENVIVRLQAHARRFIAQKSFDKKKVQQTAIKCLQKNVRIWFALKQWRWWRLYTHLKPIVNVQSHESLLKQMREELDDLKRKNERLNNDKSELKMMNNQLEAKLMNLQTEYVEEHAANAGTLDLLEVETSERIRLERELNELRPLYNETQKKLETLETEMLELRLYTTKQSIEQELARKEDDDEDNTNEMRRTTTTTLMASSKTQMSNDEELRGELERAKMELDEIRSHAEARMREKDAEIVELERQCSALKRKYQKVCEQVQDVESACNEYKVRNRELERVQAKFDAEMATLRSRWDEEKESREKCEREREQCKYELFAVKSDLETQKLETAYHQEKCERLEKDLKEYESALANANMNSNNLASAQSPSSSVTSLTVGDPTAHYLKSKSAMRDMEARLRDQEEELDEQALTIQQLEQAKLRLEMQLEKERQKWSRELAEKDAEMDDVRFHTQKKIKAVEAQLEEESEQVSLLQREKRDLERKLRDLLANAPATMLKAANANGANVDANGGMTPNEVKFKRQMLKYKQLALDAQTQLEKLRESIPKQSILKALKAQLEDSEITKANALKAKQLLQVEIDNIQQQLDESNSLRLNLEEQLMHMNRDLNNLKSELEEQERDADDILKKYQNHVQNYTLDSHRFIDLNNQIDLLTVENRLLRERIRELEEKCGCFENDYVDKTQLSKLEHKMRDLESKLEFETTFKTRLQNQLERVKQQYEKSSADIELIQAREKKCEEQLRKAQRNNKETLEEYGEIKKKLIDLDETKKRLEQQNEILERELESAKAELNVSSKRLEAFQNALNEINNDEEDDEDDDDDENLLEDDDEVEEEEEDASSTESHDGERNGNSEDSADDVKVVVVESASVDAEIVQKDVQALNNSGANLMTRPKLKQTNVK